VGQGVSRGASFIELRGGVPDQLFTLLMADVFILGYLIRGNAYFNFKYRHYSILYWPALTYFWL
jgi:hypothetical protein